MSFFVFLDLKKWLEFSKQGPIRDPGRIDQQVVWGYLKELFFEKFFPIKPEGRLLLERPFLTVLFFVVKIDTSHL